VQFEVEVNGRLRQVNVHRADRHFIVALDGREFSIDATRIDQYSLSLIIGSTSHEVTLATDAATRQLGVGVNGTPVLVALNNRRRWGRKDAGTAAGSGPQRITAPMPGKIVRVLARPGDAVTARQPLVVIEAMKMENELRAAHEGVVSEVHAQEGQSVDAGTLLLIVSPA
jgi:biotin carboxyl carrier protein